jgi:hypothetical protein
MRRFLALAVLGLLGIQVAVQASRLPAAQAGGKPKTAHGVAVAVERNQDAATGTITLKIHHKATAAKPAHDTQSTYQVTASTVIEKVHGSKHTPTTFAHVHKGEHLVVYHAAGSNVATKIEIHPGGIHGVVVTVTPNANTTTSGTFTLKIHHAATKTKPAHDTTRTFTVTDTTVFETVKAGKHASSNFAALQPGQHVDVHHPTGQPDVASRVAIHVTKS